MSQSTKPANLYCDCEFNSYQGAFISIALVSDDGREFYESVGCANPEEWVAANVMPVIARKPITLAELQNKLQGFLGGFPTGVNIIADYPVDIYWFCDLLITGPGERLVTPDISMTLRFDAHTKDSKVPHQALADARALRDMIHALDRGQHADMLSKVSD